MKRIIFLLIIPLMIVVLAGCENKNENSIVDDNNVRQFGGTKTRGYSRKQK